MKLIAVLIENQYNTHPFNSTSEMATYQQALAKGARFANSCYMPFLEKAYVMGHTFADAASFADQLYSHHRLQKIKLLLESNGILPTILSSGQTITRPACDYELVIVQEQCAQKRINIRISIPYQSYTDTEPDAFTTYFNNAVCRISVTPALQRSRNFNEFYPRTESAMMFAIDKLQQGDFIFVLPTDRKHVNGRAVTWTDLSIIRQNGWLDYFLDPHGPVPETYPAECHLFSNSRFGWRN
jgi:hypothetical protein